MSVNEILGDSLSLATGYSLATTSSVSQYTVHHQHPHTPRSVARCGYLSCVSKICYRISGQVILTFENHKGSGLVTEALFISGDIDRGP